MLIADIWEKIQAKRVRRRERTLESIRHLKKTRLARAFTVECINNNEIICRWYLQSMNGRLCETRAWVKKQASNIVIGIGRHLQQRPFFLYQSR